MFPVTDVIPVEFRDGLGVTDAYVDPVPVGKGPVEFAEIGGTVDECCRPARSPPLFVKFADGVGKPLDPPVPTANVEFTDTAGTITDADVIVERVVVAFIEGVGEPLEPHPATREEFVATTGIVTDAAAPVESGIVELSERVGGPLDPAPAACVEFDEYPGMVPDTDAPVANGSVVFTDGVEPLLIPVPAN